MGVLFKTFFWRSLKQSQDKGKCGESTRGSVGSRQGASEHTENQQWKCRESLQLGVYYTRKGEHAMGSLLSLSRSQPPHCRSSKHSTCVIKLDFLPHSRHNRGFPFKKEHSTSFPLQKRTKGLFSCRHWQA